MKKITEKIWFWPAVLGAVIVLGIVLLVLITPKKPDLDGFAQCLEEEGAVFYGAFWCPHCQDQKALFGKSKKKLPYVECSQPDGRGQTPICAEKRIQTYPTWTFADNSVQTGLMSLKELSEKTGCELPEEE